VNLNSFTSLSRNGSSPTISFVATPVEALHFGLLGSTGMAHLRLCFATISAAVSVLLFIPGAPVHAFVQTAPFLSSARGIAPAAVRTHASAGIYGLKMLRENYDLIVIGAGPTGLTAALAAAAGGRTCLIVDGTEKGKVQFSGPTGLFSKALRDAAKKIDVRTLREMGLRDETVWKQ